MIKEKNYFEAEFSGELLAVRILGEIDHHSALGIRHGIDAMIFEKRPTRLILDLSRIDFMDSSGLGLILGRYAEMKRLGGDMVVINPNKNVMKILRLAGAERMIKIEKVDLGDKRRA
jgi:stage II sporulation protein AA (anti-sigma F factor antagonist)